MPTPPLLLRLGCRDSAGETAVATWQAVLVAVDLPPGPGLIDGIFGPKTEAATKALQRAAGIEVDGIVGSATRAAAEAIAHRDVKPDNLAHGIDVSYAQTRVNWPAVKASGKVFVYVKASQRKVDKMLASHWRGAGDVGMRRGAYHYLDAKLDVAEQVDLFLVAVRAVSGVIDLPPVLDLEEAGQHETPDALMHRVLAWLEPVEAELGVTPMIYTSVGFSPRYLCAAARQLQRYGLWVADWSTPGHPRTAPRIPEPWTSWVIWQREVGACPGVDGDVDLDMMMPGFIDLATGSPAG